jgi:putative serine protease PepD
MEDRPGFESSPQVPSAEPPVPSYAEPPAPAYVAPPATPPLPARDKASRRGVGFGGILVAALLGGLIGAAAIGLATPLIEQAYGPAIEVPVVTPQASTATTLSMPTQPLEAVAAKVVPSVVNIAVELTDAFGTSSAVGSGVIIRSDGYILTNNHVVEGATKIVVRLGTTDLAAKVVGTDPGSDLAVIKIAKTGLPVATLGDSASLQVGEGVIAVGSPFGLDKTVTSGIVSALHRTNLTSGQSGVTSYTNLIQTDAPINPGNSGGALADLSGAVVGINTLILSPAGQLGTSQSAGIGFAIPMDFAKPIADQLIAGKTITHPFLGVSAATVTPAIAQYYGLPVSSGALVQQITSGSPAETAGIRVADIIIRIDSEVIATSEDVFAAVRAGKVGQQVQIELVRGSRHLTVQATLGSQ